jgi:SpoVK/Ycf46/Vps4 family AAA+-type ATPase
VPCASPSEPRPPPSLWLCSFEKRIYIPLPEAHARERMFAIHIGDTPNELTDGDVKEMAKYSEQCVRARGGGGGAPALPTSAPSA